MRSKFLKEEDTLRIKIEAYQGVAQVIGKTRATLESKLKEVANAQIAPIINKQLSAAFPGCKIYAPDTDIGHQEVENSLVPTNFTVMFRARYNNQRIFLGSKEYKKLSAAQRSLRADLQLLAEKYGLSEIAVYGEPANI